MLGLRTENLLAPIIGMPVRRKNTLDFMALAGRAPQCECDNAFLALSEQFARKSG